MPLMIGISSSVPYLAWNANHNLKSIPPHLGISRDQNDLSRPPLTRLGYEYAWRSADGSKNNVANPDLGKTGSPYARCVSQTNPFVNHQLPDPGLVFDTLLRRDKVRFSSRIHLLYITLTPNCLVHTPPGWSFVPNVLVCRSYGPFVRRDRLSPGHRVKLISVLIPGFQRLPNQPLQSQRQ